jgi:hypothetical protein
VLSRLTQAVGHHDMNGRVVAPDGFNTWPAAGADIAGRFPVVAARGAHPPHQEALELVQRDFA